MTGLQPAPHAAVMRAAIARKGQMVVDDVREPVLAEGEALISVKACGICGSDLHTLHHADAMLALSGMGGLDNPFDPEADYVIHHHLALPGDRCAHHRSMRGG